MANDTTGSFPGLSNYQISADSIARKLGIRKGDNHRRSLFSILIYLVIIAGVSTANAEVLLIAIPLILWIYLPQLLPVDDLTLTIERNQDLYRAEEGEPLTIHWRVKNLGHHTIPALKIEESLPPGLKKVNGASSLITSVDAGETFTMDCTVIGNCGTYSLHGIEIQTTGFLGVTTHRKMVKRSAKIIILPKTGTKTGTVLRPHRVRPQTGFNLSRQGGDGIELFGIREYRPGDPLRYLNGRASARHPKSLFIQEFEREKVATVYVLLDTQGRTLPVYGRDNILRYSLRAASILSETLLNYGNQVGLYVFGTYYNWVFPGSGKMQKEKILRALALNPDSGSGWNSKLADLPTKFLTPRSLIIMISPLLGTDPGMLQSLKGRRYQILVINPDEIDFEEKRSDGSSATDLSLRMARVEYQMICRRLSESSIPVLNWQVDLPFEITANRFLRTYWQ